jgi:hypothetical protein
MNFSQSRDERLLAFYEGVRQQVEFDRRAGHRHRLAGEVLKNMPNNFAKRWIVEGCATIKLTGNKRYTLSSIVMTDQPVGRVAGEAVTCLLAITRRMTPSALAL